MRLAFVVHSLCHDGGVERMVACVANEFATQGEHVMVITRVTREPRQHLVDGVQHVQLREPTSAGILRKIQLVVSPLTLRRALASFEPDVVIASKTDSALLSLIATIATRTPVIVWEHGYLLAAGLPWTWRALRRVLYRRADAFVIVNRASLEEAGKIAGAHRVRVIGNFIAPPLAPTAERSAGPAVRRRRIVAMGRFEHEKGFDLLLAAFASAAEALTDWDLVIVGDGSLRGEMEGFVRDRALTGRVFLPGALADPRPVLNDADAFVLSSRHEGFSLALAEAMSAGLAVVSFDCEAGPRELVEHERNGLLVRAGDVGEMARALTRIASDEGLRKRLGDNARAIADRVSPQRVMPRWVELVDEVSAHASGTRAIRS